MPVKPATLQFRSLWPAILLTAAATAAVLAGGGLPDTAAGQLVITGAVADLGAAELDIAGRNFGDEPTVLLGRDGDVLVEQTVLLAGATSIVVALSATEPGTYLLVVRSDTAASQVDVMEISLGPAGPSGAG